MMNIFNDYYHQKNRNSFLPCVELQHTEVLRSRAMNLFIFNMSRSYITLCKQQLNNTNEIF